LVTALRIFAYVTVLPAIFLFFYVLIITIESGLKGVRGIVAVMLSICILFVPVFFNRLAKFIEKGGKGKG